MSEAKKTHERSKNVTAGSKRAVLGGQKSYLWQLDDLLGKAKTASHYEDFHRGVSEFLLKAQSGMDTCGVCKHLKRHQEDGSWVCGIRRRDDVLDHMLAYDQRPTLPNTTACVKQVIDPEPLRKLLYGAEILFLEAKDYRDAIAKALSAAQDENQELRNEIARLDGSVAMDLVQPTGEFDPLDWSTIQREFDRAVTPPQEDGTPGQSMDEFLNSGSTVSLECEPTTHEVVEECGEQMLRDQGSSPSSNLAFQPRANNESREEYSRRLARGLRDIAKSLGVDASAKDDLPQEDQQEAPLGFHADHCNVEEKPHGNGPLGLLYEEYPFLVPRDGDPVVASYAVPTVGVKYLFYKDSDFNEPSITLLPQKAGEIENEEEAVELLGMALRQWRVIGESTQLSCIGAAAATFLQGTYEYKYDFDMRAWSLNDGVTLRYLTWAELPISLKERARRSISVFLDVPK